MSMVGLLAIIWSGHPPQRAGERRQKQQKQVCAPAFRLTMSRVKVRTHVPKRSKVEHRNCPTRLFYVCFQQANMKVQPTPTKLQSDIVFGFPTLEKDTPV